MTRNDERVLNAFDPPPAEYVGLTLKVRARLFSEDASDVCARLEAAGLVASRMVDVPDAGVQARLYRLTEAGIARQHGRS